MHEGIVLIVVCVIVLVCFGAIVAAFANEAAAKVRETAEREARLRLLQLSNIDNMSGVEFEHYVCRLLQHRGFVAEVTAASNDFGVDIVAHRGNDKVAVQVKRYSKNVSRTAISDAVAGRTHYGCSASMVITNCYFTKGAIEFAKSTGCVLVDRDCLTEWIVAFQNIGTTVSSEVIAPIRTSSTVFLDATPAAWKASGSHGEEFAVHSRDQAIPNEIMKDIRGFSAREWPGDYSMQKHTVDEQMEDYLFIKSFSHPLVSQSVLSEILAIAAMEWPDNYSMQKYTLEGQVNDYIQLSQIPL